jgi:hypothetical protein
MCYNRGDAFEAGGSKGVGMGGFVDVDKFFEDQMRERVRQREAELGVELNRAGMGTRYGQGEVGGNPESDDATSGMVRDDGDTLEDEQLTYRRIFGTRISSPHDPEWRDSRKSDRAERVLERFRAKHARKHARAQQVSFKLLHRILKASCELVTSGGESVLSKVIQKC